MNTVIIGLGTNMGDRLANMQTAVDALARLPQTKVTAVSAVYETKPVGMENQADFLNAVAAIETPLSPLSVLGTCLGIEAALGRVRGEKDGPRPIDLDVLLFGGVRSDTFELTLPHPRILERAFVMAPMLDLFPSGRAPGLYFLSALKEIGVAGVEKTQLALHI